MGFEQLAALKERLSQQTKPSKAPSKVRSERTQEPKRSAEVDRVIRDIGKLQKRFPAAFPKAPTPKVALKVGIVEDLLTYSTELHLTEPELREALKVWCRGARYWSAQVENAPRVDLSGTPVGKVSSGEAGRAHRLGGKPGRRSQKPIEGESKRA